LEHHANPRPPPAIGALGVLAEHLDVAGGAFAMALEDFDGGRLPRSVWTEEGEDLPRDTRRLMPVTASMPS
jgi:hypothetical protein